MKEFTLFPGLAIVVVLYLGFTVFFLWNSYQRPDDVLHAKWVR